MSHLVARALACLVLGCLALVPLAGPARAGGPPGERLHRDTMRVGALERRFAYHLPAAPARQPALVLAFHGGGGTGDRLRGFVGAALERLADAHGFIVVYPDGFEGHWNDCRAGAPYRARVLGVDDVGFVRALVERFARTHHVDPRRVRALGFSNGAHLAYRLALEAPDTVQAVAAFAANLPAADALDCRETGRAAAVMVVNGTADPINPYGGGAVTMPDGTVLGRVRSADATLAYFARLANHPGPITREAVLAVADRGQLGVDWSGWRTRGRPEVSLYTIHGGGHTIPGPEAAFPAFLGPTERRFRAVDEAVRFFDRQAP